MQSVPDESNRHSHGYFRPIKILAFLGTSRGLVGYNVQTVVDNLATSFNDYG